MNNNELKIIVDTLRALPQETEWIEFKTSNFKPDEVGEYISALANSACLHDKPTGYLVFGIADKSHAVVGTSFEPRSVKVGNEEIENWLAHLLSPRIDFRIHECDYAGRHVVIFKIDASHHIPVKFKGEAFIRVGSYKKKLKDYPEKERKIWLKAEKEDWSAQICEGASLEDLDPLAIEKARVNYKSKFPEKTQDVDQWDNITFLNKAKVTIKDSITRTAILLLGRTESEHYISPADAKIRWVLKDARGNDKDYHIETCPLLLAVDRIYAKIRNLKYRYIKDGTLFPDEVDQYEPFVIREALNNCIAHQDYTMGGRINVIEMDDQLIFSNLGSFIPGSVEKVVREDAPEEHYRNHFLATAMFNLKMVDTAGGGIRKMFNFQKNRFFPMPEYDLAGGKVKVTVVGKVLDFDFARVLARNPDLSLEQIIALDKVQKKKKLTSEEIRRLKGHGLIEGRKPNFVISAQITASVSSDELRTHYLNHRGLEDEHYKRLILEYLKKFGNSPRKQIEEFLWDKLPAILSDVQKKHKVTNLLSALRMDGKIQNSGYSQWTVL